MIFPDVFQAQFFSVLCKNHNKFKDCCNLSGFYNKQPVLLSFLFYQDKRNINFLMISGTACHPQVNALALQGT
jgi:hypothetical protein